MIFTWRLDIVVQCRFCMSAYFHSYTMIMRFIFFSISHISWNLTEVLTAVIWGSFTHRILGWQLCGFIIFWLLLIWVRKQPSFLLLLLRINMPHCPLILVVSGLNTICGIHCISLLWFCWNCCVFGWYLLSIKTYIVPVSADIFFLTHFTPFLLLAK